MTNVKGSTSWDPIIISKLRLTSASGMEGLHLVARSASSNYGFSRVLSYRSDLETLITSNDEMKQDYSNVRSTMAQKENGLCCSDQVQNDYEQLETLATQ